MEVNEANNFTLLSLELDRRGLVWHPEIGDEIALRDSYNSISILVDPEGMTPKQLRNIYFWRPSVEQIVEQVEARQALIFHAGIDESFGYEVIIKMGIEIIEAKEKTLRLAFGLALCNLLSDEKKNHNWH